jgi:Fe-S cluster assembly protein SufD
VAPFAHRAFVALNTALFVDGACILIPAHTAIEKPIHVRFISTGEADRRPAMSNPRLLVVLGGQSRATVVESYVGPKGVQYFTNAVTEIVLGENAVLDHYKLQCESMDAYHTPAPLTWLWRVVRTAPGTVSTWAVRLCATKWSPRLAARMQNAR